MMTKKQKQQMHAILTDAYIKYAKELHSHAFFKLHDRTLSEDLVQDTFMKTWKYLARGGKIDVMKAFLYHILNNLVIDEYRKRKHATISLDLLLEKGFETSIGDHNRIFNVFDGNIAHQLIGSLTSAYQKVMKMRYIQDLSLKEISLITGQTKNTIAVRVHRGLEKLKLLYHRTGNTIFN